jgi:hypothetical protein
MLFLVLGMIGWLVLLALACALCIIAASADNAIDEPATPVAHEPLIGQRSTRVG